MKEPVTNAEKGKVMKSAKKVVSPRFINFVVCFLITIFLVLGFWGFFNLLNVLGCPLPMIAIDKFFELGFFSFSTFSFIIFLTMIPFQTDDLRHLHKTAADLRPIAHYMEMHWPFLKSPHSPEIIASQESMSVPLAQINIRPLA